MCEVPLYEATFKAGGTDVPFVCIPHIHALSETYRVQCESC